MKAIPPHSHAAPRVDRLARRREPQPSPEGALHGGHTGTPWSEITASRRSEERLWKLVFIYRYRLFCTRCTVGRLPVLRVRPDASTGSGQGVHGVSKDWVEVLKPGLNAVRLTVRAEVSKPYSVRPEVSKDWAEPVEALC